MAISGHVLAGAEDVARRVADRGRGRRARGRRRGAGALHAGVHVGLVVVADVEHVVVALEHAGQAAEADVGGAAVAALGDHAHLVPALDPHRGGNAGGDRGGVAEQRVQPGDLPGRLGIGRGEHLEAAGGVDGDQLVVGGAHRRIQRVARAERLAAALAGAVARVMALARSHAGLHGALRLVEQAVADGEGAGLVELESLDLSISMTAASLTMFRTAAGISVRRMFSAIGPERRVALARQLLVDRLPVEVEKGQVSSRR